MKNLKRIIIGALVVFVLAGIVFGGFVVFQNDKGKKMSIESDFIELHGLRYAKIVRFERLPISGWVASAKRTIILQNVTDKDIEIGQPEASCSLCTTLTMKNNIVPARGILKIEARVVLPPSNYKQRIIGVAIPQKDRETHFVKLHIKSAFSTFSQTGTLAFENVFIGREKTLDLEIKSPSENEKKGFVSNVKTTNSFVKSSVVQEENRKVKDRDDEIFWENTATIPVTLAVPLDAKTGEGSCELEVVLRDGKTLKIPVSWNVVRKPVFEPQEEKFSLVALEAETPREFQIIYNADVGGNIEKTSVCGRNLEIIKTQNDGDAAYIKLRYTPGKNAGGGRVGELIIETKTGSRKLEIWADEQTPPKINKPTKQPFASF